MPTTVSDDQQRNEDAPFLAEILGCPCFGSDCLHLCVCSPREKVLRAYSSGSWHIGAMSAIQRAWCLKEIASVEGYDAADYKDVSDADLGRAVLDAWRDYARDKGLY